ncbi:atlastin-3-like isoform X2 [Dermacentor albipictus]|uniref:atlastin-3-like isoform X2 n=1 Tax=Dermacentor albipictus TaxID=60249 RepID=UPI0038FCE1C5
MFGMVYYKKTQEKKKTRAAMCDRDSGGQPLRILDVDERCLVLDEHALASVLLADHVKDKPVVVIAVVGTFRKGKSFLLCFLLRYLRNLGRADWLGDPNAPLRGFEWCGGSDRNTKGIVIWSEVFLVKTSRGEELAVLLMDTQGTFDCQSSNKIHRDIFALSAMISSVLVYNVSQNIQEDDLQHLQNFMEYGLLWKSAQQQQQSTSAAEGEGSMRPFQSLWFLVRDWMSPREMEYGAEGGRKLLDKRLTITPGQDKDLRRLREKIRSCFKAIRCFLLPFPGEKVAITSSSREFDGRLSDIGDAFKQHLAEFTQLLLEPENLLPKEINGRRITCQELITYFRVYVRATKRGRLREPTSMMEVTEVASIRAAMEIAFHFYTTSMLKVLQRPGGVSREIMQGQHYRLREEALERYRETPKMGGKELEQLYLQKLEEKIDTAFEFFCEYLKEKKSTVFDSVVFKVMHGVLTAGLAAGAIALAVVELPIVASLLAAAGAVSLTGHIVHKVVDLMLAKRKRKARQNNASRAAGATNSSRTYDDDSDDEETPLCGGTDDNTSVASTELPGVERISLDPPLMVIDEEAMTEAANVQALARAHEHYSDGMEQVCGESLPRLTEEGLKIHHYRMRESAEEVFFKACYSAGKRVLRCFVVTLESKLEEQFKNFTNQNREK